MFFLDFLFVIVFLVDQSGVFIESVDMIGINEDKFMKAIHIVFIFMLFIS